MRYFSVKNYEKFQHYKTRANDALPTWIKVYHGLLTDFDFQCLSDVAKAHLMLIWVLASRLNNRIPYEAKWVTARIGSEKTVDLDALEQSGWIVLEQSENRVLEQSDESPSPLFSSSLSEEIKNPKDAANEPVSAEELMSGWNYLASDLGLPSIRELSKTRMDKVRPRLKEHPALDWWKGVLRNIRGSPFCQGVNDRKWKVDFDWLIENDNNALKVYEGKYAPEEIGRNGGPKRNHQGPNLFSMQQKSG